MLESSFQILQCPGWRELYNLTALCFVHNFGHMDIQNAIILFDALSQETRLCAFRLLVEAGPKGLPAGAISEKLGTPHNTMSFHLNHLSNAGIVTSRREGRSVIYSANFELMRDLIRFMVRDCCAVDFARLREGSAEGCAVIELPGCGGGKGCKS